MKLFFLVLLVHFILYYKFSFIYFIKVETQNKKIIEMEKYSIIFICSTFTLEKSFILFEFLIKIMCTKMIWNINFLIIFFAII
jgi:hypothetical protein